MRGSLITTSYNYSGEFKDAVIISNSPHEAVVYKVLLLNTELLPVRHVGVVYYRVREKETCHSKIMKPSNLETGSSKVAIRSSMLISPTRRLEIPSLLPSFTQLGSLDVRDFCVLSSWS